MAESVEIEGGVGEAAIQVLASQNGSRGSRQRGERLLQAGRLPGEFVDGLRRFEGLFDTGVEEPEGGAVVQSHLAAEQVERLDSVGALVNVVEPVVPGEAL